MLKSNKPKEPMIQSAVRRFSLKNSGIGAYHAVPAAIMIAAGLVISVLIGEASPAIVSASASSMIPQAQAAQMNETEQIPFAFSLYEDIDLPEKDGSVQSCAFNQSLTTLSEDTMNNKIDEIEEQRRKEEERKVQEQEFRREVAEASGQKVYAGNRNLYRDHYRYSVGPSKIPNSPVGFVGVNTAGIPMSAMQPPPTLELDENGVPTNYVCTIDAKATAYYGGSMTSTGSPTRQGVVAVDPRIIPYGTEMYITSLDGRYVYGFCRAEDTGGFIYTNYSTSVDLYMETYAECCNWGRRGVKIYILPTYYK